MMGRYSRVGTVVGLAGVVMSCEGTPETAPPPAVYSIEIAAGGTPATVKVATAVPVLPSVRVLDAAGNPVAGVGVLFAPTQGGGTVTGAERISDANGVATVGSWVMGEQAGEYRLTAVTTRSVGATAEFAATALPGDSAAVTLSLSEAVVATSAETAAIRAVAVDEFGNVLNDVGAPALTIDDPLVAEITAAGGVRGLMTGRTVAIAEFAGTRWVLPVRVGGATASISTIPLTSAFSMDLTQSGTVLIARGDENPNMVELNPLVGSVTPRHLDVASPRVVGIPPDGSPLYTGFYDRMYVVDPSTLARTDSVPLWVSDFAFSSDGASLVTHGVGFLSRVNRATLEVLPLAVSGPISIAAHPTEPWVFVTNGSTITKRNIHTLDVIQSVPGGEQSVTLSPDGSELYAVQSLTLTVFSTADLSRLRTMSLPSGPTSTPRIAVSPSGARVFLAFSGRLFVFDAVSGVLLENRALPSGVGHMRYVPAAAAVVTIVLGNVAMVIR